MSKHWLAGRRALGVALVVLGSLVYLVTPVSGQAGGSGFFGQILDLLRHPQYGLAEIKREVVAIEAAVAPPAGPFTLSSGLFGLPSNAVSVDWMVVNNASTPQTLTVTVYRHGIGIPREAVAPGPLTVTLAPTETTHNANSVGPGEPFNIGFYYEVMVETNSLNVLPSVHVWPSMFNEIIPGTLIPPGSWVRLR
jgi:hypothetical protein